jgi:adenylate cyclase
MSALKETLTDEMTKVFDATWNVRDGQVVPKTADVVLSNGAVKLHAVVLYADLARSTQLAMDVDRRVAAKVVRAYLATMTRLVNANGGTVRSFDGDRVMGVFVGDRKNTNAAECALRMNHLVTNWLRPKAEAKFPSLRAKGFVIQHCVGMSRSDVLVARAGVRGSNDLVFIGAAPNIAAKLSEIRNSPWHSYMTKTVFERVHEDAKLSTTGKDLWKAVTREIDGKTWSLYKSNWSREP